MIKDIQIWKIVIGVIGATVGGVIFDKVTTLGVFLTLCISVVLFFGIYGGLLLVLKESFVNEILRKK